MTWHDFKGVVDDLLAEDRQRLGVQQIIDRQVRLAIGDIQRLIDYYRKGFRSLYALVDATADGRTSTFTLPQGVVIREMYLFKISDPNLRRPITQYDFSNRNDLIAGVVDIGCRGQWTFYAHDYRDGGRKIWVYPGLLDGYEIEIISDAILGRGAVEYLEFVDVPFDEPMAPLVVDWVKGYLAREVAKDLSLANDYRKSYAIGIARLYSEVQERLRQKAASSSATGAYCPSTTTTTIDDELMATSIFSIQGWEALRQVTGGVAAMSVRLAYLDVPNDGQGGWYDYYPDSVEAEIKPDVMQPIDRPGAGRWVKSPNNG